MEPPPSTDILHWEAAVVGMDEEVDGVDVVEAAEEGVRMDRSSSRYHRFGRECRGSQGCDRPRLDPADNTSSDPSNGSLRRSRLA